MVEITVSERTDCELVIKGPALVELLRKQGYNIPEEKVDMFLTKTPSVNRKSTALRVEENRNCARCTLKLKWVKKITIGPDKSNY